MNQAGYYRYPTIHQDTVVLVSEDDLWTVAVPGGVARRLTSSPAQATFPALSPDGQLLAFTGRDEGHAEVYCMPASGGPARRLTFFGTHSEVVGWTPDGQHIIFASNVAQHYVRLYFLYAIPHAGGEAERLPVGAAVSIAYGPDRGLVIGRNTTDLAYWKRYRGGRTGDLWIDREGSGSWRRLIRLKGNVARPLWLGDRIYFVSDHEGVGNLFSCTPGGEDLRQHTDHREYYVRHPASDGRQIVYHAGADLCIYDPASEKTTTMAIEYHSPQVQRNRKFVDTASYLQDYALHPGGHSVAIISRGKPFTMANWEGAVIQHGEPDGVRYRLVDWLHDGKRLIVVGDATGEERLEIHAADMTSDADRLDDLDIGRPVRLLSSPKKDVVALSNHRNEILLVDLEAREMKLIDRSRFGKILGMAWSPDGRWLAYGFANSSQTSVIKLLQVETAQTWILTQPVRYDVEPAFDPDGKYLYFLSYREFTPVYDNLHFDLNFPWGMRPYVITLQADLPSPFVPVLRAPGEPLHKDEEDHGEASGKADHETKDGAGKGEAEDEPKENGDSEKHDEGLRVEIDLEGIVERVVAFPVPVGRYRQIQGLSGKVLFSSNHILRELRTDSDAAHEGKLEVYDFEEQNHEVLISNVHGFALSKNAKTLIYRSGNRLRVLRAGDKPERQSGDPSRKNGWLDLNRIKISITPQSEWTQMYREAWRLQRDRFWTEDMSDVDWQAVYQRYYPLLERVATRSEFSDLMWEMQGELGTSHAYEFGGDYPPGPEYDQGFLAADLRYDSEQDGYFLASIVRGDAWDEAASTPLAKPGVSVKVGDRLLAINGRKIGRGVSPQELLVNQAGNEILLKFARDDESEPRIVLAKALRDETPARYREWVEGNRQRVHEATDDRVGYLHIPDMGPAGYAEFHRGYLAEVDREALIVDVRFNRGGHVSSLLLEKLARRRLGYDVSRWSEPEPYPPESVMGPLVALTNEAAGSDGDMFSHAFKLMGLGPLIGTRTWGGVIGINVNDALVDGGVTTQPEYSIWFKDVGWGVENYGTEPDIEVEISPQDYVAGRDPQLERAIEEIQKLLAENPPERPDFGDRPRLPLPSVPEPKT